MSDPLAGFIARTAAAREAYALPVQAAQKAEELAHAALALLFPHFAPTRCATPAEVRGEVDRLRVILDAFLVAQGMPAGPAAKAGEQFIAALPALREAMERDAQATCEADPAAHSVDEVILAYPGFRAISVHRVAHELYRLGVPLMPRILSEWAHSETGCDIHPGAAIGESFFIDHATGVVVGETTSIGRGVKLYQGVTLGALSHPRDAAGRVVRQTKRHPTVGDGATLYANATVLGGTTVIGADSIVGGSVFLTRSVPAGSRVAMKPPELSVKGAEPPPGIDFEI